MHDDRRGVQRRYAFVGTGHRAEMYVDSLLRDHADVGVPVAWCDPNPARMAYYDELYREATPGTAPLPTYHPDRFDDLLVEEQPDAVVVATVDHTHHVFIEQALDRGVDVIVEKPLTTDRERCARIVAAVERSDADLVVTFNYRYAPRNSRVKELLLDGAIGDVTSVHFEWVLDTVHGADYFRRWHRDKRSSGGLLVHKSTHHFDLVNWWLDATPEVVVATGALRFYGGANARTRSLGPRPERSTGSPTAATDPFALDLRADDRLRRLYLEAEEHDGYLRDRDVFTDGITIEDNAGVLVRYDDEAFLTYSLNAHAPWEGYRVAINGTEGRLELDVVERGSVAPASAHDVVGRAGAKRPAIDPSATGDDDPPADDARPGGASLLLQRHWQPAERIAIPEGKGAHGGGDRRLLSDLFRGSEPDPLGRRAGYREGVRSVAVGIAANASIESGQPVELASLGLPLGATPRPELRPALTATDLEEPR